MTAAPAFGRIDAVLLDMDGTLLDTESVYVGSLFAAVADLGLAMPETFAHSLLGLPGQICMAMLQSHFGPAFDLGAFREKYEVHRTVRLRDGIPLKPGVHGLLDHLDAARIPMAVATSSSRRNAEAILAQVGLRPRFRAVVTRDDVAEAKPHPEIFLAAAAALGARPGSCVAVEDSHVGVRSAHAAGTMVVMVPDMVGPSAEIRQMCRAVARDLDEVRGWLTASS